MVLARFVSRNSGRFGAASGTSRLSTTQNHLILRNFCDGERKKKNEKDGEMAVATTIFSVKERERRGENRSGRVAEIAEEKKCLFSLLASSRVALSLIFIRERSVEQKRMFFFSLSCPLSVLI
jgi:hypothetical protein